MSWSLSWLKDSSKYVEVDLNQTSESCRVLHRLFHLKSLLTRCRCIEISKPSCLSLSLALCLLSENQQKLAQLEEAAKAAGKGKWGAPEELALHVRDIKWNVDNPRHFVESNKSKELDGKYIAFFVILPDDSYTHS